MWKTVYAIILTALLVSCGGGKAPNPAKLSSPSGPQTELASPISRTVTPVSTLTPSNPSASSPAASIPAGASTTAQPDTRIHVYSADPTGAADGGVADCWTSSIASGRDDAFRCNCSLTGGSIYDPCFTYQSASGGTLIVCPSDPRGTAGSVACTVQTPLPTPDFRRKDTIWFMMIEEAGCIVYTGTNAVHYGEFFEMGCYATFDPSTGAFAGPLFDCHHPAELEPGSWYAKCAPADAPENAQGQTTPRFVSDIWK
jgi:hypothetical protein